MIIKACYEFEGLDLLESAKHRAQRQVHAGKHKTSFQEAFSGQEMDFNAVFAQRIDKPV